MKTFTSLVKRKVLKILLPAGFWLAVWFIIASIMQQSFLIPSPLDVVVKLYELLFTKLFWLSISATIFRIITGAVLGIFFGIFIAVICYTFDAINYLIYPAIRIIRSTPVASFIILVLLWTGKNNVPIVISCLTSLPIMFENIYNGLKEVDEQLLEMSDAYEFSKLQKISYIWFPALRSSVISGINNAIGLAWKSGVAAEVLCIPRYAVGAQIYNSKLYLETSSLFAWTLTVIVLSIAIEFLVHSLLKERSCMNNDH